MDRKVAQRAPADDVELSAAVGAAQQGDEAAFRCVYQDLQPRLLRYLRALVGEDAEDIASEAWLHIVKDLPSFRGTYDGFRGWATTIARNRALDHVRMRQRRPRADTQLEELAGMASDEDTALSALDGLGTERALGLIMRLPRDQAEAVLLRVVIGLDAKTAGLVLGKRAGAVRTAAYRGLKKLAGELQ
ncbi:RNA polymerase sigma factor [Actinocorallia herbida]|uniref:RNA polymerase sigma factor n=1 Tax=Actinocorallia herbida TaxID=58109 RepID=UPI001FEC1C38|nr:RNA polymerase sigma factor [Actinocorallia herbida]